MIGAFQSVRPFCLIVFLSFFSTASVSAAMAGGAPKQLYNKSIDVSWGENTSNKRIADGVVVNTSGKLELIAYISSMGRPFIRVTGGNNNHSRTGEFGPEVASRGADFHGNVLVLTGNNKTGVARQFTITFDAAFSGCTATVRGGRNGASPKWIGFDGAPYELLSISPGSASCSIKEGNAVGGH